MMKKNILSCLVISGLLSLSACNKESSDADSLPARSIQTEKDNRSAESPAAANSDLITAARTNNLQKMKEAVANGADINTVPRTIGKITQVEQDPDGGGRIYYHVDEAHKPWTALMWACANENVDAVKFLLSKGADMEFKALTNGDTALILTVVFTEGNENTEIVKLLLDHGAQVNSKNNEEFSPLALAAEGNNLEIAKLLVAKGADVNSQNAWQETPLMHASAQGFTDMVKLLLDNGANPNLTSDVGVTPLLLAVHQNQPEVVKLLLKYKADVHIANKSGYTPLRIALEDKNTKIIKLLKAAGAKK